MSAEGNWFDWFFFFLNVNVLHYYPWTNIIIIICWTSTYTRSAIVFCYAFIMLDYSYSRYAFIMHCFFILQRIHWNEILQKCTCFSFSTNRWVNYLLWTRSLFFVSANYQRLLNHRIYHRILLRRRTNYS